jgi:hypothetical protein
MPAARLAIEIEQTSVEVKTFTSQNDLEPAEFYGAVACRATTQIFNFLPLS